MRAGRAGMALAALLAMAAGAEAARRAGRSRSSTSTPRSSRTWAAATSPPPRIARSTSRGFASTSSGGGAANLPEGQTLTLTITDIDLAGEFEHWRGPRFDRVRTYRDVFPPRFALRFALADATGAVLREGQRDLTNTDYLVRSTLRSEDPLRYDKTLLDQWLAREFPRPSS